MKMVMWLLLLLTLGCTQESRQRPAHSPEPCAPVNISAQGMEKDGGIRSIRAIRRGDSVVGARFMDVTVDSAAILAWYRVVDVAKPVDTIDYAFFVFRFRGIPLYDSDTEADLTPDRLKARLRGYYALTYLAADRSGMYMTFYGREFDYDQNPHALAYESVPTPGEAYELLQRWTSPHVRPKVDTSGIVTGFVQPTVGQQVMISSASTALFPEDLRPALVIAGQVCVDAWLAYIGSAPVVRTAGAG